MPKVGGCHGRLWFRALSQGPQQPGADTYYNICVIVSISRTHPTNFCSAWLAFSWGKNQIKIRLTGRPAKVSIDENWLVSEGSTTCIILPANSPQQNVQSSTYYNTRYIWSWEGILLLCMFFWFRKFCFLMECCRFVFKSKPWIVAFQISLTRTANSNQCLEIY